MKMSIFLYSRGLFHNSEEAGMLVQAFLHDVSNNYSKTGTKWKRHACPPLLSPCPMDSFIQRLNNPGMVYMPDIISNRNKSMMAQFVFPSFSQTTFQKTTPLFLITEGLGRLKTWKLAACYGGQRGNEWKSQENALFSLSFSPLSTSGSFTGLADKLWSWRQSWT